MSWLTKPNKVYIELIVRWLQSEVERLNNVLRTIETTKTYHDDYVRESLKSVEISVRQMRKFIESN